MIHPKKISLILAVALSMTTILACGLTNSIFGTSEKNDAASTKSTSQVIQQPTVTLVPILTHEVLSLATQISSASVTAQHGGPVVIEITEEQATSAANLALSQSEEQPVKNLQIRFTKNQMSITGDVNQSGFNLPLTVIVRFTVDSQGKPHSEVVSAEVGFLSIPEDMLNQLTSSLDSMILSQFSSDSSKVKVENLTISDGKMTLVARID